MFGYKKKSQVLVLAILIIICGINTNFFKNFAEVILHKFDDRIVNRYGFCSGESIGYLLYLKKKYEIKNNPKIINYVHTPSVNWAMVNTKNINKSLNEAYRVLKKGGRFLCLEFSKIENNNLEILYKNYSKLIPKIGEIVVGEKKPYEYLVKSIENFISQKQLIEKMNQNNFVNCEYRNLSGGIVSIHSGWKI